MSDAPSCAIVIFGASGDLANRKLLPALYDLAKQSLLNDRSYILGYARSSMSDDEFRRECRAAVERHARLKPFDPELWTAFEKRLFYMAGDYGSPADHARARARLDELDRQFGTTPNRLFYIATPPAVFEPIINCLGPRAVSSRDPKAEPWQRIIIEKPFGHDLPSARALNHGLHRYFAEEQIFRIDHYLGKETVQNLLVMRFANSVFEPIWNYKYIDHVQITVAEPIGVESRGGYYDKSGALRDMVQNHMLQLTALVAMEPPAALDAVSIRDEKVKVFKSIRPIRPAAANDYTIRGRYGPSPAQGFQTPGYLKEKDVSPSSTTETFVALKLFIDNWRWSGMPFYLRTGKFLPEKLSEVVVRFRSPPQTLFQKQCESPVYPNDLIIRVQPDEGISFRLNGKVPGSGGRGSVRADSGGGGGRLSIKPVALDFLYRTTFSADPPEAYERLIYDAILGDQTLFIRGDEAEAAWSIIDPIEQGWAQSAAAPEPYTPGTWGPKRASDLIERDGRRWLHTTNGASEPIIACSL